jgi:hypothetical protein
VANTNRKTGTLRRAKAAAAALGTNLTGIAHLSGCTLPHLRGVLLDERKPSARLADAIKDAFGATWLYVVGQINELKIAGGR